MDQAARWIANLSWQGGILIIMVLVLRVVLGRSLSPLWKCALWMLVGIRLILPGFIKINWPTHPIPTVKTSLLTQPVTNGMKISAGILPMNSAVDAQAHLGPIRDSYWLADIWAIGVALIGSCLIVSNIRLGWRVLRMSRIHDERTLNRVSQSAREIGLKLRITVVQTSEIRSPAVWGVFRPVLLLPENLHLSDADLRLILLHELAHIKHGHIWIEWVVGALKAVHWFNPLVWIASSMYRADREMTCDQTVLRRIDAQSQCQYGACLLRVIESVATMQPHAAAIGVFGQKRNLHRRITMVAAYSGNRSRLISAIGLIAFIAIGCAAAAGPKNSSNENKPQSNDLSEIKKSTASTASDNQASSTATFTRVYDIRDLLVQAPDFFGPTFSIATIDVVDPKPRPVAANPTSSPVNAREQNLKRLIQLVEESIAPESWRDHGGADGTIREMEGQLIITQTASHQEQIQRLFTEIRQGRSVQITIVTQYLYLDQKTLDAMGLDPKRMITDQKKQPGDGPYLRDPDRFIHAIKDQKGTTILTSPRLTLFNGQHAYVMMTNDQLYPSGYSVIQAKNGDTRYEPQFAHVQDGTTLEVQATATTDHKSVTLSVKSKTTILNGMKSASFKPADPAFAAKAAAAGLTIQTPDVTTQTAETTFSIPNGQTGVLVPLESPPSQAGQAPRPAKGQTFILIKPTIIVQHQTSDKDAANEQSHENG